LYKKEFATVSDDKLIIDGLANLGYRPNDNQRMFFSQLEELLHVLKESYTSYGIKPERPAQLAGGGYSEDDLTKYGNNNINLFAKFLFTQMFRVAALENVC